MTVVDTAYGKIRGTEIADGVLAWRGVPYAAPPVGALRLRPPQPPEPWAGVRDALDYGNRSPQPDQVPAPQVPLPPMEEDCLYLNVTAPAGARTGRCCCGSTAAGSRRATAPQQAGDGAAFAKSHGLVVVTFNYRLGALGFLDVPGERPTGAFGLHDQIAALRWTRENIAAFGGDPERITVYGLSAGGKSVTNLLASPLTRGLISAGGGASGGDQRQEPGAGPRPHRAVPPRARHHVAADQGRARRRHPRRAARRRGTAGVHLDLAGVRRRDRAHRRPADGDRGRRGGRDPAAAADVRPRDRPVPAHGSQGRRAGGPCSWPGTSARNGRQPCWRITRPPTPGSMTTMLRGVVVMTDERYVVRTERLAAAHAAHAPVWRSRYDGPYTGTADDPEFAQYADLLHGAHGSDGAGIWQGGDGLSAALHEAWAAFTATGDPGWPRYTPGGARQAMVFGADGPRLPATRSPTPATPGRA